MAHAAGVKAGVSHTARSASYCADGSLRMNSTQSVERRTYIILWLSDDTDANVVILRGRWPLVQCNVQREAIAYIFHVLHHNAVVILEKLLFLCRELDEDVFGQSATQTPSHRLDILKPRVSGVIVSAFDRQTKCVKNKTKQKKSSDGRARAVQKHIANQRRPLRFCICA